MDEITSRNPCFRRYCLWPVFNDSPRVVWASSSRCWKNRSRDSTTVLYLPVGIYRDFMVSASSIRACGSSRNQIARSIWNFGLNALCCVYRSRTCHWRDDDWICLGHCCTRHDVCNTDVDHEWIGWFVTDRRSITQTRATIQCSVQLVIPRRDRGAVHDRACSSSFHNL